MFINDPTDHIWLTPNCLHCKRMHKNNTYLIWHPPESLSILRYTLSHCLLKSFNLILVNLSHQSWTKIITCLLPLSVKSVYNDQLIHRSDTIAAPVMNIHFPVRPRTQHILCTEVCKHLISQQTNRDFAAFCNLFTMIGIK